MSWPSPQDYNEAIQNPQLCFCDERLRCSTVELSEIGLPKANSGSFASVYRVHCDGVDWAVRCFLRNVTFQRDRYTAITKYVLSDDLPYTVPFEYIHKGILVDGKWFPLLRMEWVEGITLDQYVLKNLQDSQALDALAERFLVMHHALLDAGIAHCDLQHGNVLVTTDGELRLVDYDGMFVPELEGRLSNELGHANYQHPARGSQHFGPYLDNFSAWVIYASIRCLSLDPSLLSALGGADECLLFHKIDFRKPAVGNAFRLLESHANEEIRSLARMLRYMLVCKVEELPPLAKNPPEVQLPALEDMEGADLDAGAWLNQDSKLRLARQLPAVRQIASSATAEFAHMTMLKKQASQHRFKFGHKGLQRRFLVLRSQRAESLLLTGFIGMIYFFIGAIVLLLLGLIPVLATTENVSCALFLTFFPILVIVLASSFVHARNRQVESRFRQVSPLIYTGPPSVVRCMLSFDPFNAEVRMEILGNSVPVPSTLASTSQSLSANTSNLRSAANEEPQPAVREPHNLAQLPSANSDHQQSLVYPGRRREKKKVWSLVDFSGRLQRGDFEFGREQLQLVYLEPKTGRPIAIYFNGDVIWLI